LREQNNVFVLLSDFLEAKNRSTEKVLKAHPRKFHNKLTADLHPSVLWIGALLYFREF